MATTEWYANVPTPATETTPPVTRGREEPDPVPTEGSLKRKAKEQKKLAEMKHFLKLHKFEDINEAQQTTTSSGCLCFGAQKEQFYPVHVAAKLGDVEILSSLLRAGADKEQPTSKGRTALQLARSLNVQNSHLKVIQVLEGKSQKESQSVLNFANTALGHNLLMGVDDGD
mmetsp:Transcript_994/g.965  ORF Transcript_994/g.965 Transcript_994/m.965 type:complete len:171 (-) Transcript_994:247-759(-)